MEMAEIVEAQKEGKVSFLLHTNLSDRQSLASFSNKVQIFILHLCLGLMLFK